MLRAYVKRIYYDGGDAFFEVGQLPNSNKGSGKQKTYGSGGVNQEQDAKIMDYGFRQSIEKAAKGIRTSANDMLQQI